MAVRNFWISADIDGRETKLRGGPRAKNGGMVIMIYQRDEGGITTAAEIWCEERNGELRTEIIARDQNETRAKIMTKR